MNSTTITIEQARGLVLASAKGDIRYYLNGSLVDFELQRAVSTDGHCLLVINIAAQFDDPAFSQAIIPREALETIAKAGKIADSLTISYDESGVLLSRSNGQQFQCQAIDGKFPEYTRVLPAELSGDVSQFNPELMARTCKALRLACGLDTKHYPYVAHNGTGGAVISFVGYSHQTIAVCMPCRVEGEEDNAVQAFMDRPPEKVA